MLSFQYEKKECCPRDDGISEIKVIFTAIRCQCEGKKNALNNAWCMLLAAVTKIRTECPSSN